MAIMPKRVTIEKIPIYLAEFLYLINIMKQLYRKKNAVAKMIQIGEKFQRPLRFLLKKITKNYKEKQRHHRIKGIG
jgi:hypothetical protein